VLLVKTRIMKDKKTLVKQHKKYTNIKKTKTKTKQKQKLTPPLFLSSGAGRKPGKRRSGNM